MKSQSLLAGRTVPANDDIKARWITGRILSEFIFVSVVEEKLGTQLNVLLCPRLTLIVFLMSCDCTCKCCAALRRDAVGWSAVCDSGIYCTYFYYTDARVFVLRIRVSCAFSMRCTHVRFKVR